MIDTPCVPSLWREAARILGDDEGWLVAFIAITVERYGSYTNPATGVHFVRAEGP